ncbi:hypothetical protein ACQR3P_29365 [Rhodococcus sp. IEGM1300]
MGANRVIKVQKLANVLEGRLAMNKKEIGKIEKNIREVTETMRTTDQFIEEGKKRRVNPSYDTLVKEQYELRAELEAAREKKRMYDDALKRYDMLEASREGKRYLEDATIEVSMSQMVKWGIEEEDVS